MNPVVDHVVVAILVLISALIAGYSLSPLKAKRWLLSKISPLVGIRVITWLLPKNCGCSDCPTTEINSRLKTRADQH
ncbi:MAG: hypothetical protein ABUL58_03545 [Steroidobacter sp.]